MKHTVNAEFTSGMSFNIDVSGHILKVDAHKEAGGNNEGPPPKQLMLAALAGCTGMDVVSMLRKMKIDFASFGVSVEGDLTEEHPKHYREATIYYRLKGKDIPYDKVEHAVKLSMEKYCGVSAVYRKAMEIKYEIEIY